jgi:outer membrane protein assembly factor BamE
MQKLLICLGCLASLALAGCSSSSESGNAPRRSMLERIPIVYRPDIQQGNMINQDAVDQLRPGMSKTQVRFLLGTPMLVDVFHQDRWDYVYAMTEGWGEMEQRRLSVYFAGDALVRLEGDFRPQRGATSAAIGNRETVVSVPDYGGGDQGVISRAIRGVGNLWEGSEGPSAAPSDAPSPGPGGQAAP